MKKAILLGIGITLLSSSALFANDIFVFSDYPSSNESLFASEDQTKLQAIPQAKTAINNTEKEVTLPIQGDIDQEDENVVYILNNQNSKENTTKQGLNNESHSNAEANLAKQFIVKYNIFGKNSDQEHSALTDTDFVQISSNFINLVIGGRTQVIPGIANNRGNFIELIGRSMFSNCNTNSCLIDSMIKHGIISNSSDNSRKLTYFESKLILWRAYIYHKNIVHKNTTIQSPNVNISRLVKSNRFTDFEVVQITQDRDEFTNNSFHKEYNSIHCYYNIGEFTNTVACFDGDDEIPYFLGESSSEDQSYSESQRLSSHSKELFLSQTIFY